MSAADGAIAARYSRALFDAAQKKGEMEKAGQDLADFAAVLKPSGLKGFLENPTHSMTAKHQALERVGKMLGSTAVRGLLKVLLKKSRVGLVYAVSTQYAALLREAQGILDADVLMVHAPNDSFKARLDKTLARLTGKKIKFTYRSDPALVGGFAVRLENDLIDASIRTRIEDLKRRLLEIKIN